MLGLIGEGLGLAAQAPKAAGVTAARIEVEKIIDKGSGYVAMEIPFTPRSKTILESTGFRGLPWARWRSTSPFCKGILTWAGEFCSNAKLLGILQAKVQILLALQVVMGLSPIEERVWVAGADPQVWAGGDILRVPELWPEMDPGSAGEIG